MTICNQSVPIVIEKTGRGERAYDIYSRLLRDRIIFLGSAINDEIARFFPENLVSCWHTYRA